MKRKTRFVAIITAVLMCSLLSGCKSSDYKKAQELYSSGNYEEAQTVFFKLGDYEDSAQMVEKCEKQKKYQALQYRVRQIIVLTVVIQYQKERMALRGKLFLNRLKLYKQILLL